MPKPNQGRYIQSPDFISTLSTLAVASLNLPKESKVWKVWIATALSVVLVGCGGNSGDVEETIPGARDDNTPPFIENQELRTILGSSIGGQLVAVDAEADRLKFYVSTKPQNGAVELDGGNGSFVYTPIDGFSGTDRFQVTAADGIDISNPAQITISVDASLPASPSTDTSAPSLPEIASVVSEEGAKAKFYWLPAQDDQTAQNRIQYAVYVEKTPIDSVSGLTPKARTLGMPEALANVEADTQLYALVTAQDEAGNVAVSTQYNFISWTANARVDDTVSLNRDVDLHLPEPKIEADRLKYTVTGSQTNPEVGDYLVGSNNGGYLRKVLDVTDNGSNLEVETSQARVADVFSEFSIGGQLKLVAPPQPETETLSRKTRYTMRSIITQKPAIEQVTQWPSGGMAIIDSQPAEILNRQTSARALTSSNNGLTINIPTVNEAITVKAGDQIEVSAEATISEQDLPGQEINQFEVKSIEQDGNAHSMASLGMSWVEDGAVSILRWRPKAHHVAEDLTKPYNVTLIAKSKTSGCGMGWWFCSEKTELTVPIYVNARHSDDSEISSFSSYGGNFSANLDIDFEPSLITDIKISDSTLTNTLESATLSLRGNVGLTADVGLTFDGQSKYEMEKTVIPKRHYAQVYAAGPIPVVQVTTLSVKAALVATADGSISLEETFDAELNMEFGLRYDSGEWNTIQSANKDLDFNHTLNAEANVSLEVRLIPEVSVSFYSVATAGMSLQPYLAGQLGANYQMLVNSSFDQSDTTQLYRLTKANAELGLDAGLYAALSLAFVDIARYPSEGYHTFDLVEPVTLFSLPQAQLETFGAPSHISNTSMEIQMTGLDGQFNGFANDPGRWESFPRDGIEILPLSSGSKTSKAAIRFSRPDEYRVIYHHSSQLLPNPMGRQYSELTLDFRDSDGDGMNNHWETTHGLDPYNASDASLDFDSDGMTALEEYNLGFDPNEYTDIATIPSAPTGVTVSAQDEAASIEWSPVANAIGYRLHFSKEPFVEADIETANVVTIEDVTSLYELTGLTNGDEYFVALQTVASAGDSGISEVQTVIPSINPPNNDNNSPLGELQVQSTVTNLYPKASNVPLGVNNGDAITFKIGFEFSEIQAGVPLSYSRLERICGLGYMQEPESPSAFGLSYSLPEGQSYSIEYSGGYSEVLQATDIEVVDCGLREDGYKRRDYLLFVNSSFPVFTEVFEIIGFSGDLITHPIAPDLQTLLNSLHDTKEANLSFYWAHKNNELNTFWGTYHYDYTTAQQRTLINYTPSGN